MERANVWSARGRGRCTGAMAVSVLLQIETYRGGRRGSWTWAKEKIRWALAGNQAQGENGKRERKKIEVGMVQIGLGHNYKIIYIFCAKVLKQQIK